MKVIDLLNLVYEKKVPKKIKYNTKIYEYDEEQDDYSTFVISHYEYLLDDINVISQLNDEVEILEEKPKFEIDEKGYIHTNGGAWKGRKMDIEFAKTLNYLLEKSDKDE